RALSHMTMHAGAQPDAAAIRRILKGPRWSVYRAQSDYAAWLARWRDTLPDGALHIETLGRIKREPHAVLKRICGGVGLPWLRHRFSTAEEPVLASRADKASLAETLPEIRAALAEERAAFAAAFPALAAELEAEITHRG